MLYIFPCIGSPAYIVMGPPCAKLRTYPLQISYQAFEPFFISRTRTISTEFCEHFLRYLLPLRVVYMMTHRISKHTPDRIICIWLYRSRQQQDMLSSGVPGEKIPTTTNDVGRHRIERVKHTA